MPLNKSESPVVLREIESTVMAQIGSSPPSGPQRRNSAYIESGERSNINDPGNHQSASSSPAAFNLQKPSGEDGPPVRAARTRLPSQPQSPLRDGFVKEFVEHWLSRTVDSSNDTSSAHMSDERLICSESPVSNEFRPINGNAVDPTRSQRTPIATIDHRMAVPTPAVNAGDPVLALLQMQRDDAILAHEPQTSQPDASSSQMPAAIPASPPAEHRARWSFKRKNSSTEIESATIDKRPRFMGADQTDTPPKDPMGHLSKMTTAQMEGTQKQVRRTTIDVAIAQRVEAAGIGGGISIHPASVPVSTCPAPGPADTLMSTNNITLNPATANVTAGATNGPATATTIAETNNVPADANYSQLIPKILRSFPTKGFTLPLSEIYGHVRDWKISHGITSRVVNQSIRASLNRMQETTSKSLPTVLHVRAAGARTGEWRLLRPQDWQPLIPIQPRNAQAAAAQVTVPDNATASATGPDQANGANNAIRNVQLIAAEALALLRVIEPRDNVQKNSQVFVPTTTLGAASARDLNHYPDARNKNAAPDGPTTMQGSSGPSKTAVAYPTPSTSSPESSKSATQSQESSGSSSETFSRKAGRRRTHGMTILEILAEAPAPPSLRARAETSPNPSRPQVHQEATLDFEGCMRKTTL